MAGTDEPATERPPLATTLGGAMMGTVVNVLLHYIGPQTTRTALRELIALCDRHAEQVCRGECTLYADGRALLTPYIGDLIDADAFDDTADLILETAIASHMSVENIDAMVNMVFQMSGLDTAKTEAATA